MIGLALTAVALAFPPCPATAADAPAVVWKHYIVQSPSTDKVERFWVGHTAALKPDGKYPVIYFLPGLLDDENNWKAALEPQLASFEIIAVCPAVGGATWFMNSPARPWMRWGDFLTDDLRAFVESHYPASREKGQRGIAGISAGGHAVFYHAVKRPDLYGSVSVLSGAMELRGYAGTNGLEYWLGPKGPQTVSLYAERSCVLIAGRLDAPPPFALYLDVGDKDGALAQMDLLRKALDAKAAKYKWNLGSGTHSWPYWTDRTPDHLAWHGDQFAQNRRDSRYTETPTAKAAELKVLDAYPAIDLSDEAVRRLQAPWGQATKWVPNIPTTGLLPSGTPISATDAKYKAANFSATLAIKDYDPRLQVYRLTLSTAVPLPRAGTMTLLVTLRNGRNSAIFSVPAADFAVPAGEADRRVDLRARLAIEMKPPDPLRGGIIAGLQLFDAAGQPAGKILVGKAAPGTPNVERWPLAPQMQAEFALSLGGSAALPMAAIQDVRFSKE
jgi:S-formylglutathione hydrolase FrmB